MTHPTSSSLSFSFHSFLFLKKDRVSCLSQVGPKLLILQLQPQEYWDWGCVTSSMAYFSKFRSCFENRMRLKRKPYNDIKAWTVVRNCFIFLCFFLLSEHEKSLHLTSWPRDYSTYIPPVFSYDSLCKPGQVL